MRILLKTVSLAALLSLSLTTGCALDTEDEADIDSKDPLGCLACGAEGDIRELDNDRPVRGPRVDLTEDDIAEQAQDQDTAGTRGTPSTDHWSNAQRDQVPGTKSVHDLGERLEDKVELAYCEEDADCPWQCNTTTNACVVPFLP